MGLNNNIGGEFREDLLPAIKAMVDSVSRKTHRAGLLLNHYVMSLLPVDPQDTAFDRAVFDVFVKESLGDQVFFSSLLSPSPNHRKHPGVYDFYDANCHLYEDIPPLERSSHALNSAARSMVTNVSNYLWMTLDGRLKRLCQPRGLGWRDRTDKNTMRCVIDLVRGRSPPSRPIVMNEFESDLIAACKGILQAPDGTVIDKNWLLTNPGPAVRLYYYLLRRAEDADVRRFSLLPVFGMKAHFVTIDSQTLHNLLTNSGFFPPTRTPGSDKPTAKEFTEANQEKGFWFRRVFKLRGDECWKLGNVLKTDGVSLRVNVWRPTLDNPEEAESFVMHPRDHEEYFSCDPGQSNQAFVKKFVAKDPVAGPEAGYKCVTTARLTWRQYKLESHIRRHRKQTKAWGAAMKEEYEELSRNPVRTSRIATLEGYLRSKVPMYDRLWAHHLHDRMAKLRWDHKIHRDSCIDRFWSKLASGNQRPLAAGLLPLDRRPLLKYGSAKWGHGTAPNQKMFLGAKKYFRVVKVDEFGTTLHCTDCGARMVPVYGPPVAEGRRRKVIRGSKRCKSDACRHAPLKSRDGNAATGIGMCHPHRPDFLRRPGPAP